MKQINLATTIMCMLAVPVISSYNIIFAYGYIAIFLLAIGWEKKKPTGATPEEIAELLQAIASSSEQTKRKHPESKIEYDPQTGEGKLIPQKK